MEIDARKLKILQAIIHDYVITAEPVGSRTLAKKYDLGVSSATIRNEMADLEEMGYLQHLHTSSGRKPSDKGYRLYVDEIMQLSKLSPEDEFKIKSQIINMALYEVDKIVKQATTLLAELTNLTCIVKTPSMRKSYIKAIQLIKVDNSTIVAVIVTDSGIIKNTVIRVQKTAEHDVIARLSDLLDARLKNLTIEEINLTVINNIKNDLKGYEEIFDAIIPALYESLNENDTSNVYLEGSTNIFNYPEYKDIDKAREFLSMLNDKASLKNLLVSDKEVTIKIGSENKIEEAKECSIISASYNFAGRPIGKIGVIGPTRVPYSRIISILTKMVSEINASIMSNYYDDR